MAKKIVFVSTIANDEEEGKVANLGCVRVVREVGLSADCLFNLVIGDRNETTFAAFGAPILPCRGPREGRRGVILFLEEPSRVHVDTALALALFLRDKQLEENRSAICGDLMWIHVIFLSRAWVGRLGRNIWTGKTPALVARTNVPEVQI